MNLYFVGRSDLFFINQRFYLVSLAQSDIISTILWVLVQLHTASDLMFL